MPLFSPPDVELEFQRTNFDHFIPAFTLTDSSNGSNGFTILGDAEGSNLSYHMKVTQFSFY